MIVCSRCSNPIPDFSYTTYKSVFCLRCENAELKRQAEKDDDAIKYLKRELDAAKEENKKLLKRLKLYRSEFARDE
jgi:hypothetical protein